MNVKAIPPAQRWRRTGELPAAKLGPIAIISCKEFVATIAGQSHGHMLSGHPADMVRRNDRRISERLFHRACYVVHCSFDVRLDEQFVVLGVKVLGNSAGMVGLIEVLIGKADGKSLHAL